MRIDGQYVGLGLGDSSDEIRKIKAFMRRKFASYAGDLADTPLYDEAMTAAVAEMQARYSAAGQLRAGLYIPGIVGAETKYVMGYLPRPVVDTRPVLITVCGTGVPWWIGPDADTARAVEDKYLWQPIGYPAAPFPMGKSIAAAITETHNQANRWRERIETHGAALAGYSQGAVVVSELWMNHIAPEDGSLHWMKPHIEKAVTWGNPNRELGHVWADHGGSPMAPSNTQGVSSNGMRDTPPWWRDYAHQGDLYACTEPGDTQEVRNAIWQIVRDLDLFTGPDSLLAQVIELVQAPLPETIAITRAILDAGMFFAKRTGPHVDYNPQPAIDYLRT
ncbi:lysin B [Mycobacterium phage BuzzLyseyear]|uniref:Lysin B n=2 Tax=Cheoctovirus TaxID=1623281 RepID=A0A088FUD0_9CAUD|nr:endolysin [Mycobacterium phage BuzzLyseyear]YP_009962486.1 endolysin [Mycobacterium phage Spikelee]AIM50156.1 lysin B [Mycobacterium phage BuzzLyseyear]AXQ62162.1 lysin B [Mycobacterium phage Spikelee]